MPGRNHSREFKLQVVGQINAGLHTTAQLCREHSLAPSLIHRWRKEVEGLCCLNRNASKLRGSGGTAKMWRIQVASARLCCSECTS